MIADNGVMMGSAFLRFGGSRHFVESAVTLRRSVSSSRQS
jgi:hypothetical protein